MEFFEVVARRYSHKASFDYDKKIPEEDLRKIVEAGMAAPSAGNSQSPEFIIITDEKILERISIITQNAILWTAPAMIAVVTRPRVREVLDITTECLICDFAVATENMLLAATALGYCCGWMDGPFTDPQVREKVEELLGIPDDRMLILVVPIGYPLQEGPRREKKPFEQRASWNRYAVERG